MLLCLSKKVIAFIDLLLDQQALNLKRQADRQTFRDTSGQPVVKFKNRFFPKKDYKTLNKAMQWLYDNVAEDGASNQNEK